MNNNFFLLLLLVVFFSFSSFGQKTDSLKPARVLSLQDVILLAKQQSPAYYYAVNLKENKYWQWRTYKSNYMPQLSLTGTLPDFNRSYTPVTQPDGTTDYISVSNVDSDINLKLNQSIGLTGGSIFVQSQLRRFDNLKGNRYNYYSGNPAMIGFNQPILGFNRLAWDKRIEPLKYEESQKEYIEQLENISYEATNRSFRLLLAQINYFMAEKNRSNNDTIFKIAQGRYNLGKIAENELLQLELTLMNAQQDVAQAQLDLETSTLALKFFIGITDDQPITLILPDTIPQFEVFEDLAISEARKNRKDAIAFKRRLLEAEREIVVARSSNGLQANLNATYGLTNRAPNIPDIYANPIDQQSLTIGFQIPIVDWGRSKSRMKTAQANQKLVQNTVQQDESNFDQQVYTHVKLFRMLRNKIKITQKSDEIAQKRYDISKSRYMIGKIGITDLNIALQEKDQAKRSYIQSLRDFWTAYYELRRLTLYDFEKKSLILE